MYSYLISLSPNDIIDGKKVIDIIAYCGTEYYYKYDIRGNKIVEGKLIFIDKKNRELKFQFPIYKYAENKNKKNKYIIVKINGNIDLSNYEREKNYILCGNFQENNKMIVFNRRQIKCLDNNQKGNL